MIALRSRWQPSRANSTTVQTPTAGASCRSTSYDMGTTIGRCRPRSSTRLRGKSSARFPDCADPQTEDQEWHLAAVMQRASEVLQQERRRMVLVIDGLDQYEGMESPCPLVRYLPVVPEGFTVLCSSRPQRSDEVAWIENSGSYARIDLDDAQWAASSEMAAREYAASIRKELGLSFDVDRLVESSQGCMRYLSEERMLLRDQPRFPIERVPYGFIGYLQGIWDYLNRYPDENDRAAVRVGFGILASSDSELSLDEIAERAAWSSETRETFFRIARPFLIERAAGDGGVYRPFHSAFSQLIARALVDAESADVASVVAESEVPSGGIVLETAPIKKRWAVLIGINHYVEPGIDLHYCVNDARELHRVLQSLHYQAMSLHDAQTPEWRPTFTNISSVFQRLQGGCDPDDLLWVHFSGHGILVDRRPHILASDSHADNTLTLISVDAICRFMRASGARRCFLTLDACHAGIRLAGRDATRKLGFTAEQTRNAVELAEGFYILAATTASGTAHDMPEKQHGTFTEFLIEAVVGRADRGDKHFVTTDDLRDFVEAKMRSWSSEHGYTDELPNAAENVTGAFIVADFRTESQ